MGGHHLVLGKCMDYLSGKEIEDSHDERYRQKIARLLVEEKGFFVSDIASRIEISLEAASGKRGMIRLDFSISINDRIIMIVKYGPGSIVTRVSPAIAMSRLVASYQIPLVVVTNGEDAVVVEGERGCRISSGLMSLPDRKSLETEYSSVVFKKIGESSRKMAERIVYAYEIDGACPCDETVCRIPWGFDGNHAR